MPLQSDLHPLLVRRVAGFATGFSRDAIDALCVDETLAREAVATMVRDCLDHGILLHDGPAPQTRFRLADTWYQHARTQLHEAGEAELVDQRLVVFYCAFAEQVLEHAFGPARAAWIAQLEQEHPNLDALLKRLVARGAAEPGLRLALLLVELWFEPAHMRHGRAWFAALLALPRAAARTSLRAQALDLAGALALADGDYSTARVLMDEGLAIVREMGDYTRLGYGLLHLGHLVGYAQDDYRTARKVYTEGLETLRAIQHDEGIAHAVANLANVALELGEYEVAAPLVRDSLERYRQLEMPWNLAMTLLAAAGVAAGRGEGETAVRLAGASAVHVEAIDVSQPVVYQARHRRMLERSRAAVADERRRETLWQEGQAMALDDAVTLALHNTSGTRAIV